MPHNWILGQMMAGGIAGWTLYAKIQSDGELADGKEEKIFVFGYDTITAIPTRS